MNEIKTKIVYCITKSDWGGAQRYVYDLATALPKDIFDVTVVVGSQGTLSDKLSAQGIKTLVLGGISRDIKVWQDFGGLLKLIKIFRRVRPDIVHLNSSKMGGLGVIAAKIARVPKIIFTGHGWAFNEDRTAFQKKIIYILHYLTLRLADITIAVSEKTREQVIKEGDKNEKIVIIKNGIEKLNFLDKSLARQEILKRLPQDIEVTSSIWLGTIAELHKNKGLKYLVEAMHLLAVENDDAETLPILIIIGEGERRAKLQERINRYGLEKNVFLIGRMDSAYKYLEAFDIFMLSSVTEALPYVILEAGQAARPVIASAVGGVPEIIDDMISGILVRPKEPEEIQKAITFLTNNPHKTRFFGQKLKDKVERDFSKDKMIRETVALYQKL